MISHVRNFTTQEILYLPNPNEDTFRIYIYNLSGEIKLVSFYGDKNSGHVNGQEILNLDKNDKWRPLKFPILEKCQRGQRVIYGSLSCNVNFFRVKRDDHGSNSSIDVCSLDMGSECFFNNTLPQGLFSNLSKVLDFILNGCVAFGDIVEEKLNLIVLEDYKMHKWSVTKTVVPLTFLKEDLVILL